MTFRFLTAGESHGKALVAIIDGLPAGLPIDAAWVDRDLYRRMQGYGRGARMKIEQDRVEWLAGIRAGETLGSPVALMVPNRDWSNWEEVMSPDGTPGEERRRRVARPRPGHADLSGILKYDRNDARDILERASARETTTRVACGAVAKRLLDELGIGIGSHVVSLGGIIANVPDPLPWPLNEASDSSPTRTLDPIAEAAMIAGIDTAKKDGDTLGGEAEVVVRGLPVGLGSHVHWDRKLDARLAGMLMSIPAIKGVEIGIGFRAARLPGSEVHDSIELLDPAARDQRTGGFERNSNRAGGLEGGMTNGAPLVVRVAMKPIATLMSPLRTVHVDTGKPANAQSERSDVTAVPAMAVIAEAIVALVLAESVLEKFGGDSMSEVRRNFEGYIAAVGRRMADLPRQGEDD